LSKHRPSFNSDDRLRIRAAKTALAIEIEEWLREGQAPEKVVNAVEELMLALKILKQPA
jgi:hypothetical protein